MYAAEKVYCACLQYCAPAGQASVFHNPAFTLELLITKPEFQIICSVTEPKIILLRATQQDACLVSCVHSRPWFHTTQVPQEVREQLKLIELITKGPGRAFSGYLGQGGSAEPRKLLPLDAHVPWF